LSSADIRHALGLRPSTLAGVLDRFEQRGYTTRDFNPEDRRLFRVVLTTDGETIAATVVDLPRVIENSIRSHVRDADVRGFLAVVKAVAQKSGSLPSCSLHTA
jgi:DNA-binding MarR family transcriptional regulator